jgi:hypothetical protein
MNKHQGKIAVVTGGSSGIRTRRGQFINESRGTTEADGMIRKSAIISHREATSGEP